MSKVHINFACGLYDRMLPIYTGEVSPAGIDLNFIDISWPREIFDRMGGRGEFDAAEMSISETIQRLAAGNRAFVAIPVFPSRTFRHRVIAVNRRIVNSPKDLEGKRVGLPLYTMTAAIFQKGLLQHDHGVDLSTIQWVQGSTNNPGRHGEPTILPLLKPVAIEDNLSGKSLSELLDTGEIAATLGTVLPDCRRHNPDIQMLFPNYRDVERDYYRRTKIFPIMHLVVIRRDVHERHPFVATSLFHAFREAKDRALAKMRNPRTLPSMLPWIMDDLDEIREVFGDDFWPYGIEPNRPTLNALVTYLHDQGLIARKIPIEELFVPVACAHERS